MEDSVSRDKATNSRSTASGSPDPARHSVAGPRTSVAGHRTSVAGHRASRAGRRSGHSHILRHSYGRTNSQISYQSWFADYGHVSLRRQVYTLLANTWIRACSCSLVLLNFAFICVETDMRASGAAVPAWLEVGEAFCFMMYVVEFLAVVFVERESTLRESTNIVDLIVIVLGAIDYIMAIFLHSSLEGLTITRLIRLLRLLRLCRALKILQHMPELRKLLVMFVASFRTIFWSFLLCFLMMTLWSTIAVELLDGTLRDMVELQPEGWQDCARCERAFASIMDANLTFLQTVVAGDTWGLIAIPVIEAHPWSAFIFVGALATLVYGVLNLVVAVIVDTFAELRSKDILGIAEELKREEKQEKKRLQKLFAQIDKNKDGAITLVELCNAARYHPGFRSYLRVMQVEGGDVADFFSVLDENGDNTVECQEFVDQMYRFRHDPGRLQVRDTSRRGGTNSRMTTANSNLDNCIDSMEEKVMARMRVFEERVLSGDNGKPLPDNLFESLTSHQDIIEHGLQAHEAELATIVRASLTQSMSSALEAAIDKAIQAAQREMRESSQFKAEDLSKQLGWLRQSSGESSRSIPSGGIGPPRSVRIVSPRVGHGAAVPVYSSVGSSKGAAASGSEAKSASPVAGLGFMRRWSPASRHSGRSNPSRSGSRSVSPRPSRRESPRQSSPEVSRSPRPPFWGQIAL